MAAVKRTQPQTMTAPDVRVVAIESVKPWRKNPRRNDAAAPKLAEVLRVHGQRSPVVVWRKTGEVMKGNTTLKALKLLGAKTIRVQYEDFASEAAAAAYAIADNKSSEWAEWDEGVLTELMGADETVRQRSGFSADEQRFLFMESDLDKINAIEEDPSGMKTKTIIVLTDPNQKDAIVEMLRNLFASHKIDAEVK